MESFINGTQSLNSRRVRCAVLSRTTCLGSKVCKGPQGQTRAIFHTPQWLEQMEWNKRVPESRALKSVDSNLQKQRER